MIKLSFSVRLLTESNKNETVEKSELNSWIFDYDLNVSELSLKSSNKSTRKSSILFCYFINHSAHLHFLASFWKIPFDLIKYKSNRSHRQNNSGQVFIDTCRLSYLKCLRRYEYFTQFFLFFFFFYFSFYFFNLNEKPLNGATDEML